MKAVTVHGKSKDLTVMEIPTPRLESDEILVRIAYGGICGSDLHYYQDGRNGLYQVAEALVLGHEVVGVVHEVGSTASSPCEVGDKVAIHPARPTPPPGGESGHGLHLIGGGSYLGSASTNPHTQGGFVEFIAVKADQLRPIAADVPLRRAALAEPLAVSLHGIRRAGTDFTGKSILVAGVGPIGCLAIAALKFYNATRVVAADLNLLPLQVARAVGADSTMQVGVDAALEPESFDIVIEASGSPASLRSALDLVKSGGTIVQLGVLPAGDHSVALAQLVSREISLIGSWRFDVEMDEALHIISLTPELDAIVTHEFPIEAAHEAFATASDSSRSSKVLLQVSADLG